MIGSTTSIQVAAFKLDTIVAAGGAQYQGGNEGLQTFNLSMDLGNDSISMVTDSIVRFVNGKYEVAVNGGSGYTYIVGYKTFNGAPVLCIDSAAIELRSSHLLKVLRLNWLVEQVFTLYS